MRKKKKIFSKCSVDALLMFFRCSLDVLKMFAGFFHDGFKDAPMGLVGLQLFDDHQLFDDPQLFDDQLEVWTLIIQKSTVIPSSPMVLFLL